MGRRTVLFPLALFATTGITACTEVPMAPVAVAADIFLEPDRDVIEARVPRRATLAGILRTHEVGENLIVAMVDATRPVFDPRRLRAGQPYRLVRTFDGRLHQFEYEIDRDRFLRIVRPGAPGTELEGEIVPYTKERAQIAMHGEIDAGTSSLVAAIHEAGEQVQLAIEIAEVFAGEIDFNNDLRQGDSFDVLFEKSLREDEFAGYGSIVAANSTTTAGGSARFSSRPPAERRRTTTRRAGLSRSSFSARRSRSSRASRRGFPTAACTRCSEASARTLVSTTGRPAGRRWSPWPVVWSCRRAGMVTRGIWCDSATPTGTKPITCTCRPLPRESGGVRESPRGR